jgi:hypothetical protein
MKPANVLAAEYLFQLGYFEALDCSNPAQVVYVLSDAGLRSQEHAAALITMALECPDVGDAMLGLLEPPEDSSIDLDARIRMARLLSLRGRTQNPDLLPEA